MKNEKQKMLNELKAKLQISIKGLENYEGEPALFISNHNCLKDIFYLPLAIPKDCISLISPRLIFKKDIERQATVSKYLYAMPVEAHGGPLYANMCLESASTLLSQGFNLNIFPEGAYIDDQNHVYKGRTGASRILFASRKLNPSVTLIPVSIAISQSNSDLDNFVFSSTDIVQIEILPPINYEECYYNYLQSGTKEEKNALLHQVIKEGMQQIALSLNREYVDEYIKLNPKGNVMFADGQKIPLDQSCQSSYLTKYQQDLTNRTQKLQRILK